MRFFNGEDQRLPFEVEGFDGNIYRSDDHDNRFPDECWKTPEAIAAGNQIDAADDYNYALAA